MAWDKNNIFGVTPPGRDVNRWLAIHAERHKSWVSGGGGLRIGPPNVTQESSFLDFEDSVGSDGGTPNNIVYEVEGVFASAGAARPVLFAQSDAPLGVVQASGYRLLYPESTGVTLQIGNCASTVLTSPYAQANLAPAPVKAIRNFYGLRLRCTEANGEVMLDIYYNGDAEVLDNPVGGTWHHLAKYLHNTTGFYFVGPDNSHNAGINGTPGAPFLGGHPGWGVVSSSPGASDNVDDIVFVRALRVRQ